MFEGNINKVKLESLKYELGEYVRKSKDSVIIFSSRDERWLKKEFVGIEEDKTSRFL